MLFSEKLQLLRKSKGITQSELAEKLHVSRQAVTKWESGIVYPDISNLIEISDLFHITIDYLVKEQECNVIKKREQGINVDEIIRFRIEAISQTYAGHATECEPSRFGSHDYAYESGEYQYYDTWLGGERFAGEEAVWKQGRPVYAMNYYGRVLDESFDGDFLKEALRMATNEMPYRGPKLYQSGEFLYKTSVIGDMQMFQGQEEIYVGSKRVYECYYHGGLL